MAHEGTYHVPVLLSETIEALNIRPDGIYVDCTFGGGGHAAEILKRLDKKGKLFCFDQDEDAGKNIPDDQRVIFVHNNFRHLKRFLQLYHSVPVDGILADLGVSSFQIDTASRGFSTRYDGALDMRMDRRGTLTAATLLNESDERELQLMFQNYGEVTNAKTLAAELVRCRSANPFRMLSDLNTVIKQTSKGNPQKYSAQVYQAIRIKVNDEIGALRELLEQAGDVLFQGGRIAIITFHSIEDRLVKRYFMYGNEEGVSYKDEFGKNIIKKELKRVNKKPVSPSKEELVLNPRSRSAKLRVAEKI